MPVVKQTRVHLFREGQGFRQCWLWLLIGFIVLSQWWGFVQQIVLGQPWDDKPAPDGLIDGAFVCAGSQRPRWCWSVNTFDRRTAKGERWLL
jgi:hypothetical protein